MAPGSGATVTALDDGRRAVLVTTDRTDDDLRVTGPAHELAERRGRITPEPWTWLDQVHGSAVVTVDRPGDHAGDAADAAITAASASPVAVHTADCAPVGLIGAGGVIGVAHAGWRGLVAGVVEATVDRMRGLDAGAITAVVGPCIHPECYEFGPSDLDMMVDVFGPSVRGVTEAGTAALDLPAAVETALHRCGVDAVTVDQRCTGCDEQLFSHRVREDRGRQALVGWIEP